MSDTTPARVRGVDDTVQATPAEEAEFVRVLHSPGPSLSVRDLDLDAFAQGILAHRAGLAFHENPHGFDTPTVQRLSWHLGWNERGLRQP